MALLGFPPPSSDEGLFVLLVFSVHLSMHASDVLYLSFANFDTLDFDSIFGFQGAILTDLLSVIRKQNLFCPLITGKTSFIFTKAIGFYFL